MNRIGTTLAFAVALATISGCTDSSKPSAGGTSTAAAARTSSTAVPSTSVPSTASSAASAPSTAGSSPASSAGPLEAGAPTASVADISRCEAAVPALNAWIDAAQALEAGALKPAEAADSMGNVIMMLKPPPGVSTTTSIEMAITDVVTEVSKMQADFLATGTSPPAATGNAFDAVTTACKNAGAYGSDQPTQ